MSESNTFFIVELQNVVNVTNEAINVPIHPYQFVQFEAQATK